STLTELADALADVGIGRPSEHDELLRCLFAFEGHDRDNLALHEGTIPAALPTLRRVLGFLRSSAGIPHLRLLPSFASLPILTRLIRLHPEPNPRTLELLRRWLWRRFVSGAIFPIKADDEDDEASVAR